MRKRFLPLVLGSALVAGAAALPTASGSPGIPPDGTRITETGTPANPPPGDGTRITTVGTGGAKWAGSSRVTAPTTVTLITGDKVVMTPSSDGGEPTITVEVATRPSGLRPVVQVVATKDRLLAVPQDATPYLASGVLDEALFDVDYLLANGYTDATDNKLPLITQLADRVPAAKRRSTADALPGVTATAELTSLRATAAEVPKAQAGSFWASISGRSSRGTKGLQGDVAKVWLDRKVRASLDRSVPMIGARQAWAAGYDGKGVKVAVLDTGIDENHPDLKGRITAAKNFTADPDLKDAVGHGTHVASTITGTGAASGGKYKGVAPGVSLLVGKVLDSSGSGLESDVIAGMEWAAAQGAKVVNLSLGGQAAVDESKDPGALAVNRLSAATGTLFVVAAGNSGTVSSVTTPGVAEAALTVASVDKDDALAGYSSRGPLLYADRLAKPDIAGPGSDILAARAAGTSMGTPADEHYTFASGTSMATPHVAGAAAILAQAHPEWTNSELKAALMSSSKDDRYTEFEQGAGRVDLSRAITQQVMSTTASVDFGRVLVTEQGTITKQLTYRNDSAADVTLTLTDSLKSSSGTDLSTALSVPAEVVVPAHGKATVDVNLAAAEAGVGLASGVVVAAADGIQLRTPVVVKRSPVTHPVRVDLRLSAPGYFSPVVRALNLDDSSVAAIPFRYAQLSADWLSASVTLDLPAGNWSITSLHDRLQPSQRLETVWQGALEVKVDGPTEVVLDDRSVVPYRVITDRPTQQMGGGMVLRRDTVDNKNYMTEVVPTGDYGDGEFFMSPTSQVTRGRLGLRMQSMRAAPRIQLTVDSPNGRGTQLTPNYTAYWVWDAHHFSGTRKKLPLVDVGWSVEPEELAHVRGKLVLMSFTWGHGGYRCELDPAELQQLKQAGAVGVMQESGECALYPQQTLVDDLPSAGIDKLEGIKLRQLLAAGPVTVTLTGNPVPSTVYHLAMSEIGRIPAKLDYRITDRELARVKATYTPDGPLPSSLHGQQLVGQRVPSDPEPRLFSWLSFLKMPHSREELYGPIRPGHQWIRAASTQYEMFTMEERRTILKPGRMPDERWFAAPRAVGPSAVPAAATNLTHLGWCFACRDGDRLTVVPSYVNSDPLVSGGLTVAGADTRLYRGTEEVPGTPYGSFKAFQLKPGPERYKLVVDSDLTTGPQADANYYKYAAKQRSEWTFSSQHVASSGMGNNTCYQNWYENNPQRACAPQSLLYLRYAAATDLNNKISRRPSKLRITPYYEPSAKPRTAELKTIKVKVSYDDGKTWRQAPGIKLHGGYDVLLFPPRTGSAVTVHVDATDKNGNTIAQTTYRMMGLR